jgi:hypothetical protein
MKKKKSLPNLRQLMKEDIANLVATQGPQDQAPMTDVSLDEKVDHFLVQYERESAPMSQQYPQESKKPTLKALMKNLFEADDDALGDEDPAGDDGGGGGLDLGGGTGGGSGGLDLGGDAGNPSGGDVQKGPPPVPTPKINISNFAKNIARLVNDYQSLIDPKRIILNRARAYIEKNYNPETAKQLMTILDTEFNLTPDSMGKETDAPLATGALEPISAG